MDFRIIIILVCVANSVQSIRPTPKRFSTGKSLYCYLSATEGQQTTLEVSPMTTEHCTHFIFDEYKINVTSFRIIEFNSGTIPLTQWKINSSQFLLHENVKILIDVFLPKLSIDDLNNIPRDLGTTWVKYLQNNRINGIIFRFYDVDYYNGLPFDQHIDGILQNIYEDFHNNDLLLIMEDFTCSISSSVENIEVDYLISNCDIPITPCVRNEYIEISNTNLEFTQFRNIPNSKIIREFKITAQKVITPNNEKSELSYPKICNEIISREKVVENTDYCLKKYSQEIGSGKMETILFDDTETVMKKTAYFISHDINGILLRHRYLDDAENECDPETTLIVPGTQGRYPLLKAAEIGILLGTINKWMIQNSQIIPSPRIMVDKMPRDKKSKAKKKAPKVNLMQHDKIVICHEIGLERILDLDRSLFSYCTHLMFEEDSNKESFYSVLKTKLDSNRLIKRKIRHINRTTNLKIIFAINIRLDGDVFATSFIRRERYKFFDTLSDNGFYGFCIVLPEINKSDNYFLHKHILVFFYDRLKSSNLVFFVQEQACDSNIFYHEAVQADFYIHSCPIELQKCSENGFPNIDNNLIYARYRRIPFGKIIIKMSLAENISNELTNFRDICKNLVTDNVNRCTKQARISSGSETMSFSDSGTLMKQSEYYSYHGVAGFMFYKYGLDDSRGECEAPDLTGIHGPYPLLQGINKGIVRGERHQGRLYCC